MTRFKYKVCRICLFASIIKKLTDFKILSRILSVAYIQQHKYDVASHQYGLFHTGYWWNFRCKKNNENYLENFLLLALNWCNHLLSIWTCIVPGLSVTNLQKQ